MAFASDIDLRALNALGIAWEAGMADDNDDTERQSNPLDRSNPLDALYAALAEVQLECGQIEVAINLQDAAIAANDALASWLCAQAAFRRLRALSGSGDVAVDAEVHGAARALGDAQRALAEVFERARDRLDNASLHELLQQLGIALAIAIYEPPGVT